MSAPTLSEHLVIYRHPNTILKQAEVIQHNKSLALEGKNQPRPALAPSGNKLLIIVNRFQSFFKLFWGIPGSILIVTKIRKT